MVKLLKFIGKLLIGIFILLIIYFAITASRAYYFGSGRVVLALFCAIILGYLFYLNKYKY